jgi:hypothetical protein
MTSKFTELAIDCADPGGLARFWCSVLGYEVPLCPTVLICLPGICPRARTRPLPAGSCSTGWPRAGR